MLNRWRGLLGHGLLGPRFRVRQLLAVMLLSALAVWATLHSPTIFFNNQLLLGGSLGVLALLQFGWKGLPVGLAAALSSLALWGHPWGALVLVLQLLWQQLFLWRFNGGPKQRGNGRIVLATIVFWLVVGLPVKTLLYNTLLQADLQSAVALGLKEAVLGVVNAGLGLLLYLALQMALMRRRRRIELSLRGLVFATLLLLISVPGVLSITLTGQQITDQAYQQFRSNLEQQAQTIALTSPMESGGIVSTDSLLRQRFPELSFEAVALNSERLSTDPALFRRLEKEYHPEQGVAVTSRGLSLLVQKGSPAPLRRQLQGYWRYRLSLPPAAGTAWRQVVVVQPSREQVQQLIALMRPSLLLLGLLLIAAALISEGLTMALAHQFNRVLGPLLLPAAPGAAWTMPQLRRSGIRELNRMVSRINAQSRRFNGLARHLRRSEQQHRLLADNALDVITLSDPYGRPTYISPSIEKVRGWTVAEAMALPMEQHLTPEGCTYINNALQQMREAVQQGLPMPSFRVEMQQSHKKGGWIWTEVNSSCILDESGTCIGTLLVYRDISKRKQQERRLRRILDEAPIAMAINDLRGDDPQITYVNEQFIQCFGYDLSTIPRISDWARLAYPDPQQRTAMFQVWDASVAQARSSDGVVAPLEAEITTADGRVRQVLISAVLLGEAEMVVSFMDITAWRQAERELQQARSVLAEKALAITEAIPVGTYTMVLPPGGDMASFSFMSEHFLEICGLQREEAAADPFKAFACVHPEDYDAWVQANAEAFAHKQPFFGECRVVVDGEVRWISAESTPRHLADGSTVWEGVLIDITDRKQAIAQLAASEEHYRLLADNAHDVIWTMEPDGRISYLSPSIQLLRGFSPEETMAQSIEQIYPPESRCRLQAYMKQLLNDLQAGLEPQPFRGELEYYCRDGSTIWAEVIVLPTFNSQEDFDKWLGVSRDISERKRYERQLMAANQQLQELATTDGLTGVWNRRHLETVIQQAIEHSDRHGEALSLILCDIDQFKAVNDRFGHPVGDQVLIEFCRRIQKRLRSSDSFGRWGGEEFLILLDHTDAPSARTLAEKFRQLIAGSPFPQVGTVTASFGVVQRRKHESSVDWFQRVDNRIYAAKKAGRNYVAGD